VIMNTEGAPQGAPFSFPYYNQEVKKLLVLIGIVVIGFTYWNTKRVVLAPEPELITPTTTTRPITPTVVANPVIRASISTPMQGDTLVLKLVDDPSNIINFGKQEYSAINLNNKRITIIGIPPTATLGNVTISTPLASTSITIVDRAFRETVLVVPELAKTQGYTPAKIATSLAKTNAVDLPSALIPTSQEPLFTQAFIPPLPKWIMVGGFGNVRTEGKTSIRHLGVDLDAKRGDPIQATNAGRITLAHYLDSYGNTAIIEHGVGIFSLYLHMDSLATNTVLGNNVERGQVIGYVGNTGVYSIDPHLHFSIKIGANAVDPARFLSAINKYLE